MRFPLALALPLLGAALSARLPAQNLVTDLEPGYLPGTVTGGPQTLVTVGSQVFFTATHQDFGTELWVYDTRIGMPRLVLDLAPGRASSFPGQLTAWNGRLFFTANRSGLGQELWVSDGTAAGTRLVADVEPGATSSLPRMLVPTPAGLFFTAATAASGREPWFTDGTTAGTRMLRDIHPGAGSGVTGQPGSAALHGARVYFQGFEPATGGELWSTDGTSAGTALVVDAVPGSVGLAPAGFASSSAGLFFGTNDPLAPGRPWVSDGTAAGTRAVQPATGELLGLNSGQMVSVGTHVVFSAYDRVRGFRMWRSDGTGPGTTPCSALDTYGTPLTLGSVAVFFTSNLLQRTLWAVPAGTGAATAIHTWNLASTAVPLEAQAVVGGRLWFTLDVQGSGVEPWVSDGTSAGTRQVADLVPGSEGSYARSYAAYPTLRDHTLFVAGNRQRQDELWSSDGTPAGTRRVGSVEFPLPGSSQPNLLARCGDHVLFVAAPSATGQEPYSARPGSGAVLLADIAAGSRSSNAQIVGTAGERALVQGLTDGGGIRTVLGTDGTPAGTTVLMPPAQGYGLLPLASLEARTVFLLWSGRLSLWSSDGTAAGTTALQDFGTSYALPSGNVPYGVQIGRDVLLTLYQIGAGQPPRLLLARTRDGGLRYESLWEATPASTSLFFGLWSTGRSALARVLLAPNFTFLFTDGTAAGSRPVTVALPGSPIGTVGDRFLLTSRPTTTSATLYVTDPPVQGFQELVTFQGATTSFQPQAFPFRDAAGRDLALLQGFDPATGNELWITDGTPQGTRLLADIAPGATNSEPREFRVIGSRVVFSAYTLAHGREAFVTDGTTAGTRMLFDLAPGTVESEPREFTRVRTTVYFSAYHPLTGRELHAMPLLATGASLVEDVGQGCAGSAGVPVLGAVGEPARGNARFALDVAGARPSAPAAVFLGVGDARLAFGPCTLRVLPLASLPLVVGANGSATLALPIPADPSVRGLEFSAQAAIADPAGAGLGTALTQALRMMVGD